jgi:hypothetical protein
MELGCNRKLSQAVAMREKCCGGKLKELLRNRRALSSSSEEPPLLCAAIEDSGFVSQELAVASGTTGFIDSVKR